MSPDGVELLALAVILVAGMAISKVARWAVAHREVFFSDAPRCTRVAAA